MKKPIRIAVVGIDGTGKTSTVRYLEKELGKNMRVRIMTLAPRANSITSPGAKILIGSLEKLNRLSDISGSKLPISISQILMNKLLPFIRWAKERKADVIIHERHPSLDYRVYGKEYVGSTISRIEQALCGVPDPDIIVYLDANPEIAIRRILRRKNKPPHPHERSVESLKESRHRFNEILTEMESKGIKVIKVDANQPLDGMLKEVKRQIEEEISKIG